MRIAFAGTPEFAARALAALHDAGHDVAFVLTQPDRPAGRGLALQASAVKRLAQSRGVKLAQPRSLKLDGKFPDEAAAARAALDAARPEAIVVAAYGLILPRGVLDLPPRGCLNIHASLLPRWRGAAPIQRAIEAGDAATGITIMQMDEGLDTGAMLLAQSLAIAPDETTATLHERLAALGAELIVRALDAAARGELRATPQPTDGVTYAAKIDKAEARIDWRQPAAAIERRLRAFDPQPGCWFDFDGAPVKLWRARVAAGWGGAPGDVQREGRQALRFACGDGRALELLELQPAGGKRQPVAAFLAGR